MATRRRTDRRQPSQRTGAGLDDAVDNLPSPHTADTDTFEEDEDAVSNSLTSRRLSAAERQKAELHAVMRKNMRGMPRFPYPADLPEKHKPYWLQIVNSKPHDYFNDGDMVLLKMYCRAAAEVDDLDREIDEEGHVVMGAKGPILNPRVAARAVAETRLLSLSSKLRTQPSSRYDSENDRSQTEKTKRAKQAAAQLDGGDDDDDRLLARPSLQ